MIRRITSLALGISLTFAAASALAQEEGGGDQPAGGEEKKADEGKPAEGKGEAKAGGEAAASTEGVPDSGGKIKIGLRVGYGIPMGDAAKDSKMSDAVSGMIPIWLDLGYMVTPNIMVGLYGQYGLAMYKDCPSGADCSANDIRFGVQGQYHLSPDQSLDPWFGLGIGYEMFNRKATAGGQEAKFDAKGFEFANIQAGADFKVMDKLGVGPFVSFSLGQYSSADVTVAGVSSSGDIKDKAMHQWLVLGIKGTYGL